MFRRNLQTAATSSSGSGGGPASEPRSVTLICDVSGSMERHSRLLIRFALALRIGWPACARRPSSSARTSRASLASSPDATRTPRWPASRQPCRTGPAGPASANRCATFNAALGAPRAALERRGHHRLGRLGPRRPRARASRDGASAAQLPPPHLAGSACGPRALSAAGGRHGGGLSVHRRPRGRRRPGQPAAARRSPRGHGRPPKPAPRPRRPAAGPSRASPGAGAPSRSVS